MREPASGDRGFLLGDFGRDPHRPGRLPAELRLAEGGAPADLRPFWPEDGDAGAEGGCSASSPNHQGIAAGAAARRDSSPLKPRRKLESFGHSVTLKQTLETVIIIDLIRLGPRPPPPTRTSRAVTVLRPARSAVSVQRLQLPHLPYYLSRALAPSAALRHRRRLEIADPPPVAAAHLALERSLRAARRVDSAVVEVHLALRVEAPAHPHHGLAALWRDVRPRRCAHLRGTTAALLSELARAWPDGLPVAWPGFEQRGTPAKAPVGERSSTSPVRRKSSVPCGPSVDASRQLPMNDLAPRSGSNLPRSGSPAGGLAGATCGCASKAAPAASSVRRVGSSGRVRRPSATASSSSVAAAVEAARMTRSTRLPNPWDSTGSVSV